MAITKNMTYMVENQKLVLDILYIKLNIANDKIIYSAIVGQLPLN